MGSRTDRTVALMSIRPEFASKIIGGDKQVEFRRRLIASQISHVVIYSTTPIQRVTGFFEVRAIDADCPGRLWSRYSAVAGIELHRFRAYFAGCKTGVAIRIGNVFELTTPIRLTRLSGVKTAPQGYRYLNNTVLSLLRNHAASCPSS